MIPLRVYVDERRHSFFLTLSLLLAGIEIFALYSDMIGHSWLERFGLVPIRWWSEPTWEMLGPFQQISALITYAYIHADWVHCIANLWWLYVFAPVVQARFGTIAILMIYSCSGIAGGVVYLVLWPESISPLVGASANISGLVGVYLVGCRDTRIKILGLGTLVPAHLFVPLFLIVQVLLAYVYAPADLGIAFSSHVVGCLVGAFVSMSYTAKRSADQTKLTGRA